MRYFKNAELTRLYNVSDKAVRNWIESARRGKIQLELYHHQGKAYVVDTLANNQTMEDLVRQGRKFRNRRSHRNLTPSKEFYKLYSRSSVIDIINKLDAYHELPVVYAYFGSGAINWDDYLHKLHEAGQSNLLTNTIETLALNFTYIDALLAPYKNINLVNVCVGNSLAVKDLAAHIQKTKKLKKIIAIDLSEDMLGISERNVDTWFNKGIHLEKHVRDLSYERFDSVLTEDSYGADASETTNLITFVAGPIVNFKEPDQALRTIHDSMGKNDLFITTLKRDTEQTRSFFDFHTKSDKGLLGVYNKMLVDLLNIEDTFYDIEQSFDERIKLRYVQIRLKLDITVHFEVGLFQKAVHLNKGETILLWRSWQHTDQSIVDRFIKTGFEILQTSRSLDQQLNLLVAKIKTVHDK